MDQNGESNVPIVGTSKKEVGTKNHNSYVFHHLKQQISPAVADLPRQS